MRLISPSSPHLLIAIMLLLLMIPLSSQAENPFADIRDRIKEELRRGAEELRKELDLPSGNNGKRVYKTVVPYLIGKTPAQAEQILSQYNLVIGKVVDVPSYETTGTIISQSHAANSEVNENTAISVRVASPRSDKNIVVKVPDLSGMPLVEAKIQLMRRKLILGNVLEEPSDLPVNSVIAQNIKPGTRVERNSAVDVKIAKPKKVNNPKQQATPPAKVVLRLSKNQLAIGEPVKMVAQVQSENAKDLEYSFSINGKVYKGKGNSYTHKFRKPGRVIVTASARKKRGQWMHSKSQWLVIDKNAKRDRNANRVDVPSVIGLDYAEAISALEAAGFVVGVTQEVEQAGDEMVLEQKPPAGSFIEKGSKIDLVRSVSPDSERVAIPNVLGMSVSDAKAALEQAGLGIGNITRQVHLARESFAGSKILKQFPDAGMSVSKGTKVDLVQSVDHNSNFLLSVDRTSVSQQVPIEFRGELHPKKPDLDVEYRLMVGSKVIKSDVPVWRYVFENPGQYQVFAEAEVKGKDIYRSEILTIQVAGIWTEPTAIIDPPTLVIPKGDKAVFKSQSKHHKSGVLTSLWMDENGGGSEGSSHTIDTSGWETGAYWVSLRIRDKQGLEHTDLAQLIVVNASEIEQARKDSEEKDQPVDLGTDNDISQLPNAMTTERVHLSLSASDYHALTGKTIRFMVSQHPIKEPRYRISFGDGNNVETEQPWAEHSYTSFGRYFANVETRHANRTIESKTIAIWIWPSWLIIAIALLGFLLLFGLYRLLRPKIKKDVATKTSYVNYVPEQDVGEPEVDIAVSPANSKSGLTFVTDIDEGQQRVIYDEAESGKSESGDKK